MKIIALAVIAATAGIAIANPIQSDQLSETDIDLAGGGSSTFVLNISGYGSNDFQHSTVNEILTIFVGVGTTITGVGWDVNLSTIGPSWASESALSFQNQIDLIPGAGDAFSVTNMNYRTVGILDFTDFGLPNILVGADGILSIEFYELDFVDNRATGDAIWEPGSTLTFRGIGFLPTPGPLGLMGLGSLIICRRRRDSADA